MHKIFNSAINYIKEYTPDEKVLGGVLGTGASATGYILWPDLVHLFWAVITAVLAGVGSTIAIHYTKKYLNK